MERPCVTDVFSLSLSLSPRNGGDRLRRCHIVAFSGCAVYQTFNLSLEKWSCVPNFRFLQRKGVDGSKICFFVLAVFLPTPYISNYLVADESPGPLTQPIEMFLCLTIWWRTSQKSATFYSPFFIPREFKGRATPALHTPCYGYFWG